MVFTLQSIKACTILMCNIILGQKRNLLLIFGNFDDTFVLYSTLHITNFNTVFKVQTHNYKLTEGPWVYDNVCKKHYT